MTEEDNMDPSVSSNLGSNSDLRFIEFGFEFGFPASVPYNEVEPLPLLGSGVEEVDSTAEEYVPVIR